MHRRSTEEEEAEMSCCAEEAAEGAVLRRTSDRTNISARQGQEEESLTDPTDFMITLLLFSLVLRIEANMIIGKGADVLVDEQPHTNQISRQLSEHFS